MADHHADGGYAPRVRALETMLEERGVVTGAELDSILDGLLANATPLNGARIIAHAWVDAGFRQRLLDDANTAITELGMSMGYGPKPVLLHVVANTATVHHLVVCTLCSCYPISLLGPSPSWYKSIEYRSRAVRWPHEVLVEFGLHLDPDIEIRVWDASAETRYLVLPRRPEGTDGYSEDLLATLVTRNGMIGTAAV
jgi:nitrile hydratase